jgi:hypothetical protein
MATFKMMKVNRKGPASTGGIRSQDLPGSGSAKRNIDGGIVSRHSSAVGLRSKSVGGVRVTKGTPATGSLQSQVARVASNYAAKGQPRGYSDQVRLNKGFVQGIDSMGKGKPPGGSAFNRANLRVQAEGRTPSPPKIDEAPKIYNQKNKSLTMNGMKAAPKDRGGGFTGSFNGRKAVGNTGSGIGKKRKSSFK